MDSTEPAEVAIGRAIVNLAALLDREMDAVFQVLLEELDVAPPSERRRAATANRVVLLCRNLAGEIRRYERLYRLHQREWEGGGQEIEF